MHCMMALDELTKECLELYLAHLYALSHLARNFRGGFGLSGNGQSSSGFLQGVLKISNYIAVALNPHNLKV